MDDPASNSPGASGAVMPTLWEIFRFYFLIGLVSYGGSAMLVQMQKWVVERKRWLSDDEFNLGISICEVLPGGTATQMAAWTGLCTHGFAGAVVGFCAMVLPAFLCITVLAWAYFHFQGLPVLTKVLPGLRVAVTALLCSAAYEFARRYLRGIREILLAAGVFAVLLFYLHPALVIVASGVAGMFLLKRPNEVTIGLPGMPDRGIKPRLAWAFWALGALVPFVAVSWLYSAQVGLFALLTLRMAAVAFGGGSASLPMMRHEFVTVYGWLDQHTFMDSVVFGQVTPGPRIISASFIGYDIGAVPGALIGAIAVFAPSFIALLAAAPFCRKLFSMPAFHRALKGVLCTLCPLQLILVLAFLRDMRLGIMEGVLGILAFAACRLDVNPGLVVLVCGLATLALNW